MEPTFSLLGSAILIFCVIFFGLLILKTVLKKRSRLFYLLEQKSYLIFFFFIALGPALKVFDFSERIEYFTSEIFIIALMLQIGFWGHALVIYGVETYELATKKDQGFPPSHLHLIRLTLRTLVWILVLLFLLDNLNFDIAALIAGLGIGGIAIALAVQGILSDLLSSVSILLDKPFRLGHTIQVDAFIGVVEKIGIKTTHVRSLDGELIIFSNSDLLKSRIRNFEEMKERRVVSKVKVPLKADDQIATALPDAIKQLFSTIPKARFQQASVKEFTKDDYLYEITYYIESKKDDSFRKLQHEINLKLSHLMKEMKLF
ncbi:MAG: mechanosensitive ion channel domain-containing protein [Waddliaceae bacterium]